MYLDHKKIREFEDKIGFKELIEKNIKIGKFLNFEPKIEYAVCANGACCYSPKNAGSEFSHWQSQKAECERWLEETKKDFPEGWVAKGGYQPTRLEYYPQFHSDWNHLMEAIKRLAEKCCEIPIDATDIFYTWELVYENCKLKFL